MNAVDFLQVSLQEDNAASRPQVPHPAERIQPSDWMRDRHTERHPVLHRTTPYYTVLPSTTQYYTVLTNITPYYTVLQNTTHNYTILDSTTQ